MAEEGKSRRALLVATTSLGAGWVLTGCATSSSAHGKEADEKGPKEGKEEEEEVTPAEDLMREHGVLRRVLLVYEEAIRRLTAHEELPPQVLAGAAQIVRRFVEDYHERMEEDYLFPRFKKAGTLVDLVTVLREQHEAGRKLTAEVLRLATSEGLRQPDSVAQLTSVLQRFIRMYQPHAAREDTVLFPAIRKIVSSNEYDSLGEDFERKEHDLFGEDGFEKFVDEVASLEKALNLYELSSFTPR
jgi:hemerythrin-like domain-containing protein